MEQASITIVEVGPRDGFQPIGPQIPVERKIGLVQKLHGAGLRRIEVTAFVSPRAVPQLADASEVLAAAQALPGLDAQVLVPNSRNAARAIDAGATHLAFVLSVSPRHNMNNVRRTPEDSIEEYATIVEGVPPGTKLRLNLATSFDCPFDGIVETDSVISLLDRLVPIAPDAEICLCDTTGRVTPDRVQRLFEEAMRTFPHARQWAFHGHDTYGLGVANAIAAWRAGVAVIDASFGGLGGCPFAPGATGNVATEDVAWTFAQMGVETHVDLQALLAVARDGACLPGSLPGGRVRTAFDARLCLDQDAA